MCQDGAVGFFMEDQEYLDEEKDLHEAAIMEDQPTGKRWICLFNSTPLLYDEATMYSISVYLLQKNPGNVPALCIARTPPKRRSQAIR